ncbi:MAG: rod shape-determining protein, partial [Clostridia bacterium]|nr:rod shape-determining protein [Clostridia bacterium]
MQAKLGIDIGGANLLAAALGQGILMREPSAIAQDRETGRVLAVGLAAEQRLGQGGQSVALSRPFTNGLTAVPHVTQAVLASCILTAGGYPDKTDVLLSIPCDLTDDQEEQLVGLACRAGARTCRLVYAPLAAVAGSFMNLPQGCLAVDIGATATHVMLLCRGRIYYMKSVPTGGQAL